MSYIRSASNPEGLYIWEQSNGVVIRVGSKDTLVPTKDFNKLLKMYVKGDNLKLSCGDLVLMRESRIDYRGIITGIRYLLFSNEGFSERIFFFNRYGGFNRSNKKWTLRYKGKKIVDMYEVTLRYIANHD